MKFDASFLGLLFTSMLWLDTQLRCLFINIYLPYVVFVNSQGGLFSEPCRYTNVQSNLQSLRHRSWNLGIQCLPNGIRIFLSLGIHEYIGNRDITQDYLESLQVCSALHRFHLHWYHSSASLSRVLVVSSVPGLKDRWRSGEPRLTVPFVHQVVGPRFDPKYYSKYLNSGSPR